MTEAMLLEQRRITSLLEGLQPLARGDAGAIPDLNEVDASALIADAVRDGRRRHPSADINLDDRGNGEVTVTGWGDGLRLAIDNLLDNAVIHGRPVGHVEARLTASGGWVTFAVADDGPGIPVDFRTRRLDCQSASPIRPLDEWEIPDARLAAGLAVVGRQRVAERRPKVVERSNEIAREEVQAVLVLVALEARLECVDLCGISPNHA